MPDGQYDADILVWSEQQAALLRRMAAGERLNAEIDWANLIDEVESVGRSQVQAFESLLLQALVHLLKLHQTPTSRAARHWRTEAAVFLSNAQNHFTPSMRTRIDVTAIFAKACKAMEMRRSECPYTLDMLLDPGADMQALIDRLHAPA